MNEKFTVDSQEIKLYGLNSAVLIGALREHCKDGEYTRATVKDIEEWCGLSRNQQTNALKLLEDAGQIDTLQMGLPKSRYVRLLSQQDALE